MDLKSLMFTIKQLSEAADYEASISKREKSADFSTKPHEKRGTKVSGKRYGAQADDEDDEDDDGKKKAEKKSEEPKVKRGRGRPKKHSDAETGEVPKYGFAKELQSFIVGNLPGGKLPGKPGKKHKLSDEEPKKSKSKLKDWMEHVEDNMLAEDADLNVNIVKSKPTQPTSTLTVNNEPVITSTSNDPRAQQTLQSLQAAMKSGELQINPDALSEEELEEVAAPGQEEWIKKNKQRFIDQYGKKKGMSVLYATAWKRSKSMKESVEPVMEGYTLEDILESFPHEHKQCQEGWGMEEGLYEALCEYYFKQGRIPRKVWHGPLDELRRHVEECYMEDTGGAREVLEAGFQAANPGDAHMSPLANEDEGFAGPDLMDEDLDSDLDVLDSGGKINSTSKLEGEIYLDDEMMEQQDEDSRIHRLLAKSAAERELARPAYARKPISLATLRAAGEFPEPTHPMSHAEKSDIRIKTPAVKRSPISMTDLRAASDRTMSGSQGLASRARELGLDESKITKSRKQKMTEGIGSQLSIQQLATISDEALDKAYGYGRSSPGNTFGWQANLMSAAYAKKMIDAGVTDIEKIADAIHKGWNITAQKFVQNPDQFDDTEKLRQAGKLDAKLQQRAKLMKINYAQLDNDEQEKDRVVARALLQAIKGQQNMMESQGDWQPVKNFISGWDDNYYPGSARPEWNIKGVNNLTAVFGGASKIPKEMFDGEKRGFWKIDRDDDYPRGNWNTVVVTNPKYFTLFLSNIYGSDPNTKVLVNNTNNVSMTENSGPWTREQEQAAEKAERRREFLKFITRAGGVAAAAGMGINALNKNDAAQAAADRQNRESWGKAKFGQTEIQIVPRNQIYNYQKVMTLPDDKGIMYDIFISGKGNAASPRRMYAVSIQENKMKDAQMESWDRQLKALLKEGLTITTSTGQPGGSDSVSVNATDADAQKLMKMLQNAGIHGGIGGSMGMDDTEGTPGIAIDVEPMAQDEVLGQLHGADDAGDDALGFLKRMIGARTGDMEMQHGDYEQEEGHDHEHDEMEVCDQCDCDPCECGDEHDQEHDDKVVMVGEEEVDEMFYYGDKPEQDEPEQDEPEQDEPKHDELARRAELSNGDFMIKYGDEYPTRDREQYSIAGPKSKLPEEDMGEGNEFTKARLDAIKHGKSSFKVGDKTYKVKGDTSDEKKQVGEEKETCNECGAMMEADHKCNETANDDPATMESRRHKHGKQLDEWANSPVGKSEDEEFTAELDYMTKLIAGGLNGPKRDQTTLPHTQVKTELGGNADVAAMMKRLAGIR